jgi:SAM-dependent methyltransferase
MPFIPSTTYIGNYFAEETQFSQLYSQFIQQLDKENWSPLIVTNKAADFLANKPHVKILDIGSGAGKFCLAGAYYKPSAFFYGVEQREYLVDAAKSVKEKLGILNVEFIHKNFTQINFKEYDNFYFYNSFFENLDGVEKIDDTIDYSTELYDYYNLYLRRNLDEMPVGTRLVTFKSLEQEIPKGWVLAAAEIDNQLRFWIKE